MSWRDSQITSFENLLRSKNSVIDKIDCLRTIYNNTMVQRKEEQIDEFITNCLVNIQLENINNEEVLDKTSRFLTEISRQEIKNDYKIIDEFM